MTKCTSNRKITSWLYIYIYISHVYKEKRKKLHFYPDKPVS